VDADYDRSRQDLDALLATSRRLMAQMQGLARQSQQLSKAHAALARLHAELVVAARQPRANKV
jgi:prefoldin subunit 5